MKSWLKEKVKKETAAWHILRSCRHLFLSLAYYIYALLGCLYLFLIGFLFPRNRSLIHDICSHFNIANRLQNSKTDPARNIADTGLKERLKNCQFARYSMYIDIMAFIQKEFHQENFEDPKIIEFGGTNGVLKDMFNHPSYEVAENYPAVDIHDLSSFKSNYYDFVILEQVLEHVKDPSKSIKEIHRILKKDGWLITTTPFLLKIHTCPDDYWRFSKQGMKELLSAFSEIIVKSWGNKKIVINHIKTGHCLSVKECKRLGIFDLQNEEECPHVVWAYSRK